MSSETEETLASSGGSSSSDTKDVVAIWCALIIITAIACVIALALTGEIQAKLPEQTLD
jgi:hypothetical protein